MKKPINIQRNRYPYCLVWTPLPMITALIPFIGHTGVCTSEGIIHDFAGPYTVSVDDMAFGNPTKYIQLEIKDSEAWDEAVKAGDNKYEKCMHDLFWNNCHSHVAFVLNQADYLGGGWNMVKIAILFMLYGKYTGPNAIFKTYIGFFIILSLAYFLYSRIPWQS